MPRLAWAAGMARALASVTAGDADRSLAGLFNVHSLRKDPAVLHGRRANSRFANGALFYARRANLTRARAPLPDGTLVDNHAHAGGGPMSACGSGRRRHRLPAIGTIAIVGRQHDGLAALFAGIEVRAALRGMRHGGRLHKPRVRRDMTRTADQPSAKFAGNHGHFQLAFARREMLRRNTTQYRPNARRCKCRPADESVLRQRAQHARSARSQPASAWRGLLSISFGCPPVAPMGPRNFSCQYRAVPLRSSASHWAESRPARRARHRRYWPGTSAWPCRPPAFSARPRSSTESHG